MRDFEVCKVAAVRRTAFCLVLFFGCAPATAPVPVTYVASPAPNAGTPGEPPSATLREPKGPVRHVIVVSIDGLLPEAYLRPDLHGLSVPILRKLVASGAVSDGARSVFPSVTYPAHTSIASGVVPARHGIVTNRAYDPLERNQEGWRWYAEDVKVPRVWDLALDAGYRTALIAWPATVGARATYLVPELWRARVGDDVKLVRALSTPGLLESVAQAYPGFEARFQPGFVTDEAATDIATHVIEAKKPHLLFLHLLQVDTAQHRTGLFSVESSAAIENADRQLGRLIEATERAGMAEQTAFVVASDHGFAEVSRLVRPGALLREAGLITLDGTGRPSDWQAHVLPNSGNCYVYLRDPRNSALAARTLKLFEDKQRQPNSGISRVLRQPSISVAGGDPDAFLAVEAAPGTYFATGYEEYEVTPLYKATHGYDPERVEMNAALVLSGPNIGEGKLLGARLVDIAPTVAAWLGLSLRNVDGRPLAVTPSPAVAR